MYYELTPVEQQLLDYLRQQNKAEIVPTVSEILYGLYSKEIRITEQSETQLMRDVYDVLDGLKKAGLVENTIALEYPSTQTEKMLAYRWRAEEILAPRPSPAQKRRFSELCSAACPDLSN